MKFGKQIVWGPWKDMEKFLSKNCVVHGIVTNEFYGIGLAANQPVMIIEKSQTPPKGTSAEILFSYSQSLTHAE